MKAVILAGGEGTRLRPLTSNQPKPMMPLVNRPMMEHIVALLARHGFDDIVVTVAYLANQIRTYFGDGSDYGVRMRYATEETPLGTAGSVRNAAEELDDTFLVIAGDVLTDIDLTSLVKSHRDADALATLALKRVENPLEFGIVITQPDGSIERFLEKPTWGQVFSDTINTNIYVCEPRVFELIPEGEVVDFSGDVFPAALDQGDMLHGHVAEGYWEDVGTLEAYFQAHADVLNGEVHLDIDGFQLGDGIWIGEGAEVDPAATVRGPVVIGNNSRVEAGAELREYTVLGTDVVVKAEAFLERAICHDHVYVGPATRLRGCALGRSTDLRHHVQIAEGVVVGDECFVGDHASISPGVKIYPFKTVEPGAVVNSSIVWESRGARTLFGRRGARGLANVDITAEVAVRLAMAYGTALPKGATVTTSRDTSRIGRALKRAVMGGLNLTGVNVEDIELSTVPLTRFQARNGSARGGISVRLAPGDPDTVELRFFDGEGRDIDEQMQRKIERLLYREDYRRAFAGDIGDITFPPRSLEHYTAALDRTVDLDLIQERGFKLVIDYSFGSVSVVLPSVLAKIGAEVLAVNPFASTAAATAAAEDPEPRLERLSDLVRTSGATLGMMLGPDGELARLVDDEGHVLSDREVLLALVTLVSRAHPGSRIALPVSVTQAAERIAAESDVAVVWAKLSSAHLMEAATGTDVVFAGSDEGACIWPDFLPAPDASATLVRLLDLLAAQSTSLSAIVGDLPAVHIEREQVPTPWERKGTLMRELVEHSGDEEVVLVDGVKICLDDEWVLVLPDPEEAITHVWAEAPSAREARRLAQEYARRVRTLVR